MTTYTSAFSAVTAHVLAAHPSWCTARHYETGSALDEAHRGEYLLLSLPGSSPYPIVPLYASLTVDEFRCTPYLYVEDGEGGAELDARQGREFVANLRAFADQVEAAVQYLPEGEVL